MSNWRIPINDFRGGLAPGYFESEYPSFGNLNMAGKAKGVDLIDPSHLRQGLGRLEITGVTFSSQVRIYDAPVNESSAITTEGNLTYAIAGDTVYSISDTSASAVHTIAGAALEDIAYYQGDLFVSYNTSAIGGVARWDMGGASWNNTWASSLQEGVPHRLMMGGLDFLYIGNGDKVASYDGLMDVFTPDDLQLPEESIVVSMQFTRNHLQVLTNRPSLTDGARSSIFLWDTNSPSWDVEYPFRERITNILIIQGTTYVHYEDLGRSRLGLLDGGSIRPLSTFHGKSPYWYQVTEHKGNVAWTGGGNDVLVWGAPEAYLSPALYPLMAAQASFEVKSLAAPFGKLLFYSKFTGGETHRLNVESGHFPNGFWKSLLYNISGDDKSGVIDELRIMFDALPDGLSFTIKLVNSSGTVKFEDEVTGTGKTRYHKNLSIHSDDIRAEIHFTGTLNAEPQTVRIRDILLRGHTTK